MSYNDDSYNRKDSHGDDNNRSSFGKVGDKIKSAFGSHQDEDDSYGSSNRSGDAYGSTNTDMYGTSGRGGDANTDEFGTSGSDAYGSGGRAQRNKEDTFGSGGRSGGVDVDSYASANPGLDNKYGWSNDEYERTGRGGDSKGTYGRGVQDNTY